MYSEPRLIACISCSLVCLSLCLGSSAEPQRPLEFTQLSKKKDNKNLDISAMVEERTRFKAAKLNHEGIELDRKGNYDGAIKLYKQAIALSWSEPFFHHNLANSYCDKGDFLQAISSYKNALKIDPKFTSSWYGLGNALVGLKRYDEAKSAFLKAIALKHDYVAALGNLGETYVKTGDLANARKYYSITGCVKAKSEESQSRSAMIIYRGRAVGCIYTCKTLPYTLTTEHNLPLMFSDLLMSETQVIQYDLPESIVLPMSALFLGYPVQKNDNYKPHAYMDYICNWAENKSLTLCLAITLPASATTCIGFVHKGHFIGTFDVERQQVFEDKSYVRERLQSDPNAHVEGSILPPELTKSLDRFGYNLHSVRKKL